MNAISVIGNELGLRRLNVRATTAPGNTNFVAKDFVRIGGSVELITRRVAEPGVPVPPFVELAATVFTLSPGVVALTVSVIVHEEPTPGGGNKVAPLRVTVLELGTAVTIPGRGQFVLRPLGDATNNPSGNVSVKFTPVSGMVLPTLDTVMVIVEVPNTAIKFGTNILPRTGGRIGFTNNVAVEVLPVPALVEVTVTLLILSPMVVAVTGIVTMHIPPAAKVVPPVSVTIWVPGSAVNIPPHVFVALPVVAINKPGGITSRNPIPINASDVLLLVMTNFIVVSPVTVTGLGCKNDFSIRGGEMTVNVS